MCVCVCVCVFVCMYDVCMYIWVFGYIQISFLSVFCFIGCPDFLLGEVVYPNIQSRFSKNTNLECAQLNAIVILSVLINNLYL